MGELKVAAAQFAARADWQENLRTIIPLINEAEAGRIDLLVLPEGVLARFMGEKERIRDAAQPLDGPFIDAILKATVGLEVTVVVGIHERSATETPYNTLVVIRDGQIVQVYRKLHLYDAFSSVESDNVQAGDSIAELLEVRGFRIGLMTCYDVRFPELARLLALAGADAIVLPAAWAKGPSKEFHWETLVSARALDNTLYMVACGEAGPNCIGRSMIVDPLGIPIAQALDGPEMITASITKERLAHVRKHLPVLEHRRFEIDSINRTPGPIVVPSTKPIKEGIL